LGFWGVVGFCGFVCNFAHMKKINIQNLSIKEVGGVFTWQNAYGVWLDYGVTVRFRSKRIALRFLAFVNEELTGFAFELNSVFTDLFCEYRRIYFNITDKNEKLLLWRLIVDAERGFERVVDYSYKHGYAVSSVRDFERLVNSLMELAAYLADWYRKKNRYSEARKMDVLAGRAAGVMDGIKGLPEKFKAT